MTLAETEFMEEPVSHNAAVTRCRTYAHFASVLGHPDNDVHSILATGQWFDQLERLSIELPFTFDVAALSAVSDVPPFDELTSLYTSQFEVGLGSVSLFGRSYLSRDEKAIFEELFRLYEHFGLKFEDGGLPEWPDWIVVELEFMHYLTFLEAGSPGDLTPIQRGEHDFIDKHLAAFTHGLAQALDEKSVAVYSDIAKLLAAFVAADTAYLETATTTD